MRPLLTAGPPRRPFAEKPPRKKGGARQDPTKRTSNDDQTLLRLRPKQGKHNRCPLSAADRRAFFSVLVHELARALDLITAGVPLNSQRVAFKSALGAMASIKREQIRRRHRFKRTPIPITP
jgi:hypothetical protein